MDQTQEELYVSSIKAFFASDAWRRYAYPMIAEVMAKELPKPNKDGWEKEYIYAHALSDAMGLLVNTLANLGTKEDFDKRLKQALTQDVAEG